MSPIIVKTRTPLPVPMPKRNVEAPDVMPSVIGLEAARTGDLGPTYRWIDVQVWGDVPATPARTAKVQTAFAIIAERGPNGCRFQTDDWAALAEAASRASAPTANASPRDTWLADFEANIAAGDWPGMPDVWGIAAASGTDVETVIDVAIGLEPMETWRANRVALEARVGLAARIVGVASLTATTMRVGVRRALRERGRKLREAKRVA